MIIDLISFCKTNLFYLMHGNQILKKWEQVFDNLLFALTIIHPMFINTILL
jgi:hypothetical protein